MKKVTRTAVKIIMTVFPKQPHLWWPVIFGLTNLWHLFKAYRHDIVVIHTMVHLCISIYYIEYYVMFEVHFSEYDVL